MHGPYVHEYARPIVYMYIYKYTVTEVAFSLQTPELPKYYCIPAGCLIVHGLVFQHRRGWHLRD